MKRIAAMAVALTFALPAFADVYVQGYMKKDGTYVPGYYRTTPNDTKLDNYSTQGNVNPYTGKPGTANPYALPEIKVQPYQPYQAPQVQQPKPYVNPYEYKAPKWP